MQLTLAPMRDLRPTMVACVLSDARILVAGERFMAVHERDARQGDDWDRKIVSDPKIKQPLRETDGIGTPATQAAIIQTLFDRKYIEDSCGKPS